MESGIANAASRSTLPQLRVTGSTVQDLDDGLRHEWLVTNGIGGYASGTVAGVNTRRYHGLLMAALRPPIARALLLARTHETVIVNGYPYPLHSSEYADGTIDPSGYRYLQGFRLDGTLPVWRYRCGEVEIEKRLWMVYGRNTTVVRYTPRHMMVDTCLHLRCRERRSLCQCSSALIR
ncbi:MAG TPA: glycogen debranching enzyme N-terminal domain-containing protein [Nitrolancea sp.]|nr:glycogen debranching enzyme N-terminal domain-containing protein [Nitrolancea sp.]